MPPDPRGPPPRPDWNRPPGPGKLYSEKYFFRFYHHYWQKNSLLQVEVLLKLIFIIQIPNLH